LRKLNDLVRDLELDSGKFFASLGTTGKKAHNSNKSPINLLTFLNKDDYEILQKAFVNLDIAKTISLSAKSNMKRRAILLRSSRRRNNREEIQAVKCHSCLLIQRERETKTNYFFISLAIRSERVCLYG
jgi:hypothetical protein